MPGDTMIRDSVGTAHPYMSGLHQPMAGEVTLQNLAVTGTIPAALTGSYLRIGPNPIAPDPVGYHWFSGDGMVHGLAIADGKALWYRNRWIRSKKVAAALGETASPGPRHGHSDTVNTNITAIAGRTYAMVEAGSYPVVLSDILDKQAYDNFSNSLAGSFTAHPHLDPLTGEHHAITYDPMQPTIVHHVVISPTGAVIREEPVTVQHGPSIHDCAITARFAIIMDLPVTFSITAATGGFSFPYRWNPDHQARIGLLPRSSAGQETIWIDIDPCYIFHVANAYDRADGRVVFDAVVYDTMFADATTGPDNIPRGLERWIIDPVNGNVERTTIDTSPQEFPRPDERRIGQYYRYIYALGLPEADPGLIGASHLFKHDLETGTRVIHDFGKGQVPGEFVFVPRNAASAEDDGWLIGLVIDRDNDTTDLVFLDAGNFGATPVARVHLPHRVPPGFHGNWIAS